MLTWLERDDPFPYPELALKDPNGLLAAGGDLSVPRLLQAYRHGVFPWYSAAEPILWWSPDPRMVLFCDELKVARSLAKNIRNKGFEIGIDSTFPRVIKACSEPRKGEAGTWLSKEMQAAYVALHRAGHAHSFETWQAGELVGGLYGVSIGRMFYGESMFSRATDASKAALVALVERLLASGGRVIDCQQATTHLASLGAREIPRARFVGLLQESIQYPPSASRWT